MGLFASFAFHARDRHGADRASHYRETQAGLQATRKRRACAYLIAAFLAGGAQAEALRVGYFHSELSRDGPGLLLRDILKGDDQVAAWLRVVRAVDADILVIGDVDFDLQGVALAALADRLDDYPHRFTRRPNRGLDSGRDLDGDGRLGRAGDAEGYGAFSGQGGMAVLSRWPIDTGGARDFSEFAWRDLPGNLALNDGRDPARLSTTVHWDVPVTLPGGVVLHLLTWHATAPVFDGPDDRNGRRNHDETRFWELYLEGRLPNAPPALFVLAGTANADPNDGESRPEALLSLLSHPKLQDPRPDSAGAAIAAGRDGGVNSRHLSPPRFDTADWPDAPGSPGNLRVDYVLPSRLLQVVGQGVYWPDPDTPAGQDAALASRHRLVWVDIELDDHNPASR